MPKSYLVTIFEFCFYGERHQLTDEAPADKGYVAIEPLDFVKPAGVVVEYVHDNTAVVDENPLLLRHTLA